MNGQFHTIDLMVLAAYLLGMAGIGVWFFRRGQSSAQQFTTGGGAVSGWLCGLSIFATFLSSITFLALPGRAFDQDWNPFVFSLTLPLAAWIAVRWFLPYYRQSQAISAYALLESRFGAWARWLASAFFLAFQLARMAFVMYLMALPLSLLFGWDIRILIAITGLVVIVYSTLGGIVAVIWADATQAVVLTVGALLALGLILYQLPGGISDVWQVAATHTPHKFSLGSWSPTQWTGSAVWLVLLYGLFDNLRNFGIDQNYIQRYIATQPRDAAWSVWLGALLYIPVSALFLLIGTALFAFYQQHPADRQEVESLVRQQQISGTSGPLPSNNGPSNTAPAAAESTKAVGPGTTNDPVKLGDRVFPHFIANHLPPGVKGLLIAAIFAAAMSTVSTSLNSSATICLSDFYLRLWRPTATDQQQLLVLRVCTIALGLAATLGAWQLVALRESALENWWTISSLLGAGILGLFLLGRLSPAAKSRHAVTALLVGLLAVAWLTFGQDFLDKKLAIVVGSVTVVMVGSVAAAIWPALPRD